MIIALLGLFLTLRATFTGGNPSCDFRCFEDVVKSEVECFQSATSMEHPHHEEIEKRENSKEDYKALQIVCKYLYYTPAKCDTCTIIIQISGREGTPSNILNVNSIKSDAFLVINKVFPNNAIRLYFNNKLKKIRKSHVHT